MRLDPAQVRKTRTQRPLHVEGGEYPPRPWHLDAHANQWRAKARNNVQASQHIEIAQKDRKYKVHIGVPTSLNTNARWCKSQGVT